MKKREKSPELEKPKTVHRGKDTGDQKSSKEAIEEYLNSKLQQMVDLYNELYSELSSQIEFILSNVEGAGSRLGMVKHVV